MQIFKVNKKVLVVCDAKNTRNGFKHEATLMINDREHATAKICYINRTWESFCYESVLSKILNDNMEDCELTERKIKNFLDRGGR